MTAVKAAGGIRRVLLPAVFLLCAALAGAQESLDLDTAIRQTAARLNALGGNENPAGDRRPVAILGIESGWRRVSDYLVDEITGHIIRERRLVPVERRRLEELRAELRFQASGEVSDGSARSMGRMEGTEIIVGGEFVRLGNLFRLTVRAWEVESGRILAVETFDIRPDGRLASLMAGEGRAPSLFWMRLAADDAWKRRWLWPGLRGGWSLHDYVLNAETPGVAADAHSTFEAAALLEVQLLDFFSLQTEAVLSGDSVHALVGGRDVTLGSWTLSVPLLAKLAWRPGIFYLAAFGGAALVFPLGRMEEAGRGAHDFSPAPALTGGLNAGAQLGPGVLFLDARFTGDLAYVRSEGADQYGRKGFSLSLGYSFGLINRGKK